MSVTYIILILTVIVSYQCFQDSSLKYKLTFSPYSVKHHKRWWLLFTHGAVHSGWPHLMMNMFTLYFLGPGVEERMVDLMGIKGEVMYAILYIAGLAFASLPAMLKHGDDPGYLAVGASGAVTAVVFAYILFEPIRPLYIYGMIPIPGVILGILYLIFETYASKQGRTNIGHDAHIAGAIFGVLFLVAVDHHIFMSFYYKIASVMR
ncbi:MAG: rhomboid family intramembrane serine protease [Flavobacteriales bacterium]|nr:rhomboid family intramembrane serine protease [Flavobacteriales bacterium]MCB9197470.1 rhomboid family intramembrane serine protease [Flavobacteriales bacterium]